MRNRLQLLQKGIFCLARRSRTLLLLGLLAGVLSGGVSGTAHAQGLHADLSQGAQVVGPFSGRITTSSLVLPETFQQPQALCLPFDIPCALGEAANFVTEKLFEAVSPLLTGMQQQTSNFLTHTPPEMTYRHPVVETLASWEMSVVRAALLVIIALAAFTMIGGMGLGLSSASVSDLLPRIALAFIAALNWQSITALVIDLNNELCLGVMNLLHFTFLESTIQDLFALFTDPTQGVVNLLLMRLLAFVLVGQVLFLCWQMLVRLATVILWVSLSVFGLMAVASPLTHAWGQLWLTAFLHAVLMQFLQVTALCLGGMLVSSFLHADLLHLDQRVISFLVSNAVFFLIIRFPAMIRDYSLRPIAYAGEQQARVVSGLVTRVAATL